MSTSIFMRGQLDLTQQISYFLVAKTADGGYYIYQDPPTQVGATDAATHGVFASTKYTLDSTWSPKTVFINPLTSGYSLRSAFSPGGTVSPFYISTYNNAANVLEISDGSQPGAVLQFQPDPTTNVGTQALWAGVWYTATDSTGNPLQWKILSPANTTGTFRNIAGNANPAAVSLLQIMFVPRDAGSGQPVGVWNGACQMPADQNATLALFSAWVDGDPNAPQNCDGPGWLVGAPTNVVANGCIFTTLKGCQDGYLYTFCPPGVQCGTCLGPCTGICVHDYDPSLQKAGVSPLSCTPKNPTQLSIFQRYKLYIIIAIVIIVVMMISVIILLAHVFKARRISQYR
jgi:hypothetical protein